MKIAKVVPLFKSGEKNVFTNYRPISLLPQFSKILEKLYMKEWIHFSISMIYLALVSRALDQTCLLVMHV